MHLLMLHNVLAHVLVVCGFPGWPQQLHLGSWLHGCLHVSALDLVDQRAFQQSG